MSQEALIDTEEARFTDSPEDKEQIKFEKIHQDILDVLEILAPVEDKEKYKEEQFAKIIDDAQKVFHTQGQVVIKPEIVIEKAKEMILSRLHSLIEDTKDSKRYITDESKSFLLRRARLALLKENDPIWSENWTIEEGSHPNLRDFFHTLNFHLKNERKLSIEELNIITKNGQSEALIKGSDGLEGYSNFEKIEGIPESLFFEICKEYKANYVIVEQALSLARKNKQTFSREMFSKLATCRPEYCLRYKDVFPEVDIKEAIDIEILEQLQSSSRINYILKNIPNDNSELIEYTIKHSKLSYEDYDSIKKIGPENESVINRFQSLEIYFGKGGISAIGGVDNFKLKFEKDIKLARDLISEGYFSYFSGNSSKSDYLDYIFQNENDWIITTLKNNDQEHLAVKYLNRKQRREYIQKLINEEKTSQLLLLLSRERFDGDLDQRIFDQLPKDSNFIRMLDCFSGLNQETFNFLEEKYGAKKIYSAFSALDPQIFERLLKSDVFDDWSLLQSTPNYFDLSNTPYQALIKECEEIKRFEVIDYYAKNFSNVSVEKRNYVRSLIKEVDIYSEDPSFTIFYINKFKDVPELEVRERFRINFQGKIKTLSENKPIQESEKEEYETLCRVVYPERNYNSYRFIDEYKDRSEDLDPYKFDKNGYAMKLDGILGYKILEGQTSNDDLLKEYSTRIESIGRLANKSALAEFLKDKNPGQKTKTLEGQIVEYLRNWGYTKDTMNVVLAYQLSGEYEQFVGGSRDRVDSSEDEVTKQYVMLDELLDRYGDRMKETLKGLKGGIEKSEEDKKQLSENSYIDSITKIEEKSMKVKSDFEKIPKDKRRDKAFRKKIESTWRTTFQSEGTIQEGATEFAQNFSLSDLEAENFTELWNSRVQGFFKKLDPGVNLIEVEKLQVQIYQELQKEANKYEEIKEVETEKKGGVEKKSSKERTIKGYFSKNKENAHARMVGDICLAGDPKMLEDKNYFEFVLFDEERTKCMGTTMLKVLEEPDGKKYLLYCPNPSVGLVSEVSAKKLYKTMTDRVIAFARGNNFDGVVLNKTHGRSTNRAGLFQGALDQSVLKENGTEVVLNLSQIHKLSSYEYKDDLRYVYRK